jgi:hypothetical protein
MIFKIIGRWAIPLFLFIIVLAAEYKSLPEYIFLPPCLKGAFCYLLLFLNDTSASNDAAIPAETSPATPLSPV